MKKWQETPEQEAEIDEARKIALLIWLNEKTKVPKSIKCDKKEIADEIN